MCHLCFSPGRDEVPESMIMWHGGKNVPAMFYKCRAEHNSILPEVHWEKMQHRELCQHFQVFSHSGTYELERHPSPKPQGFIRCWPTNSLGNSFHKIQECACGNSGPFLRSDIDVGREGLSFRSNSSKRFYRVEIRISSPNSHQCGPCFVHWCTVMSKKESATPNLFPKKLKAWNCPAHLGAFRAPYPVTEGSVPEEQLDIQ